MQTDSVFIIGDSHKVCEDYALSHNGEKNTYAVISDGCSGSKHSDVGARILAHTAVEFINENGELDFSYEEENFDDGHIVIIKASALIAQLGLKNSALDATLFSIASPDGLSWSAYCSGDGVFAKIDDHDKLSIHELNMPSGYPLYLSYLLDIQRRKSILEGFSEWKVYSEIIDLKNQCDDVTLIENMSGLRAKVFRNCDVGCFETVIAIFSDGVSSFVEADGSPVSTSEIVQELMEFKSFKGEFVKRRMQGFLRSAKKRGWRHYDDLSMAAIYLGK